MVNEQASVLVVLPMYGGSLPVGRYCADALIALGHRVEVFEAPGFYPAFSSLKGLNVTGERLIQLENSFLNVVSQAILAKVETFEPDVVLALAQAPLSRNALKRLAADGVTTAMWFVEDWRVFSYWRAFAPLYDFFAVIQKEPFLEELKAAGVRHPFYLPLAAQPDAQRPLLLTPAQLRRFGSDLSFMGAGYPNRRLAFRRFTGFNFKIWGTEWEGDAALAPFVQQDGARISPEESVKIYNAAKINLNLHSSLKADSAVSHGDFVNPRTFEIAACGGFQLVDRRALMPELFVVEGAEAELAVFDTMEECEDLARRWLRDPEGRDAMAGRARRRVLADHTYAHRMKALLDVMRAAGRLQSRERETPLLAEEGAVPGAELEALIRDLGLPRDAAFSDVVWALRKRQGTLNELETSLLFLDEWRRQYAR